MNLFGQPKRQYGTESKPPLALPNLIAHCDQCDRETPTKVFVMKAGLGNACAICGRLRRGKPYLAKVEFESLKPTPANGGNYDGRDS